MIGQITQLREQRAALIQQQRALLETQDSREDRTLSGEEEQDYDRRSDEIDRLTQDIERRERVAGLQPTQALAAEASTVVPQAVDAIAARETNPLESVEYRDRFFRYLRGEVEARDLAVGVNTAGGFTVPTTMWNQLVEYLRDFGVMRQLATVITTTGGEPLPIPKVTAYGAAGATAEGVAYTEGDETFAQGTLNAFKLTRINQVSEELIADSLFDIEAFVMKWLGQALGVLANAYYFTGNGTTQPTGITTQTSAGKVGQAGQTVSVTTDDLIDLFHAVLPPYRRNASWVLNDASVKVIRKLKDTTNQYLWQPGLTAGAPDLLLGRPVYADPDMPVMAANAKSILFGDLSYYWIRDAGGVSMQRLVERYAELGMVGFRAYMRTDGELVDTNAVKHYANSAT